MALGSRLAGRPRRFVRLIAGLLSAVLLVSCAEHPTYSGRLAALQQRAEETHTDSLVVTEGGRTVLRFVNGSGTQRILPLMSATKSLCGLAVGALIDAHKISSVNERLSRYFPGWRGHKRDITLREVLSQTSGLGDDVVAADTNLQASAAKLKHRPGETFVYSNVATNLLTAVIGKASGEPVDVFLQHRVFEPLGIRNVTWERDSAGNAPCFAGASMTADDFSKIGLLMLNGGTWNGKRVVSEAWIEQSTRPSQSSRPDYGLLWWLRRTHEVRAFTPETFTRWKRAGMPGEYLSKLLPYEGTKLDDATYARTMQRALGPGGWTNFVHWLRKHDLPEGPPFIASGGIEQYSAEGHMGQALIVVPERKTVVVRQISPEHYRAESDSFFDLWQYVENLR